MRSAPVFVSLEQDTSVCSFGRFVNLPPGAPAVPGTGCAGDIFACQVLFLSVCRGRFELFC